jgi:hypothetical protein
MAKAETEKKRRPQIDVLERRAAGIGVHGEGSPKIDLKEPGWECRWFNSEVAADHIWRAKNRKGWDNVRPEELADPEQIGGYQTSPDGFVVRGEKGREVLLKMPSEYRAKIERQKAAQNLRDMDPHRQKAEIANAAGKSLGDQAGSFINDNVSLIGNVKTTRERIAVTPEVD